jgi:hypothetical protein
VRVEARKRTPRPFDALCAPEPGKDAFHRVPDFARNEWDAVERVLTIPEDRFRGAAARRRLRDAQEGGGLACEDF